MWWAPAQSPAEVVADPQLAANDGFVEIPGTRPLRSVNGPITFGGVELSTTGPVPALGEHTDDVLAELKARADA